MPARVRRARPAVAAAVTIAIASAGIARAAADDVWLPASGSSAFWSVGSNWSLGVIPGASDNARFSSPGTFTSTLNAAFGAGGVYVSAGSVNLRSNTTAVRGLNLLNGAATVNVSGAGSLEIGGNGVATLNPMAVALADAMTVGDGTLILEDAGTTFTSSGVASTHTVGDAGHAGTLTLRDGAVAELQGTLNLATSTLAGTRGTIGIESGARLDVQRLNAASIAGNGAGATINVSGTGSQLIVRDAFVLGSTNATNALAQLNIGDGATVTLLTTGHVINASGRLVQTGGTFAGGSGIDVAGGQVTVSGGTFSFGQTATLSAGAVATFTIPTLTTDGGVIMVTGSGSRLDAVALRVNAGAVTYTAGARGSLASLAIGPGNGTLPTTFTVGASSAVDVSGGDLTLDTAAATIHGSLKQAGAGAFHVDGLASAIGDVTVDAGTLETASGLATIGRYGRVTLSNGGGWTTHGDLLIDGGTLNTTGGAASFATGATLTARNAALVTLPQLNASTLHLVATGVGTVVTANGAISTGSTLAASAGGRVLVSGPLLIDESTATVGDNTGIASRIDVADALTVQGNTARLTIATNGTLDLSAATGRPTLTIDDGAIATELGGRILVGPHTSLRVTDGSSLLATGGPITLATDANAIVTSGSTFNVGGTFTLDSAASSLTLHASTLHADLLRVNAGTLDVIGGSATFDGTGAFNLIGNAAAATTATFAGGHVATFTNHLSIGTSGAAAVSVLGGSKLIVNDDLSIGSSDATSTPTVQLSDAGSSIQSTGDVSLGGRSTVTVQNAATLAAGHALTIGAGATLHLDGGNVVAGSIGASALTGSAGTLDWTRGTLELRGAMTLTPGTVLVNGSALDLSVDKHLAIDAGLTVSPAATLRITGGSLDVAGSFDRQGWLAWTGGSIAVGGPLQVGGSGTLGSLGSSLSLDGTQTLRSGSQFTVASGGLLVMAGGAATSPVVTVASGGEVLLSAPTSRFAADGVATIDNHGLIHGNGQVGPLANAGELRGDAGQRVLITGPLSNTGRLTLSEGTIESSGAMSNGSSGLVTGRGTLIAASIDNAGSLAFSSGTSDVHGTLDNAAGGRVTVSGNSDVTFWDDVTNAATANFRVSAGSSATFFGGYTGSGISGSGTVYFEDDLTTGVAPVAISFGGDVAMGPASRITLTIAGKANGTQHDQINVSGALLTDGSIDVAPLAGSLVLPGDAFVVLNAARLDGRAIVGFDDPAQPGLTLLASWTPTTLTVRAAAAGGDADLDGDVDFTDLLALARHCGNAGAAIDWPQGDFDRDGGVNFTDLLTLARNYGHVAGAAASTADATSFETDWALAQALAPEPTTLAVVAGSLVVLRGRLRR